MTDFRLRFGKGDVPTDVVAIDPTGTEDPRRLVELANQAAGRAAMARIGQRLFGHSLNSMTKDGLMRCGQSWWEHSYKDATSDKGALENYLEFSRAQGEPFHTITCQAPDCLIYFCAAAWADQGFPTITMGEKYVAALCGTEVPEEWYDEIKAPWRAFVIEIPNGSPPLLTVFDPEQKRRTRVTRVLVHNVVTEDGRSEWWWILFSEHDQHFWRQGTVKQCLSPVEFEDEQTERYRIHAGEDAFGEHVTQDQRIYHVVSRLVFNAILTLADPERVRPTGSSHKRWEAHGAKQGRRPGQEPEQRVFIVGNPIKLDCREELRDYLEGRSKRKAFKVTTQFLVRGHWRWQAYGPNHSLRRRQWIEPFWKGPEDGVIPVRDHDLGESDK
jgi:hypothetical protein